MSKRYGSPPRVWGKRVSPFYTSATVRFTPTCVGKTPRKPGTPIHRPVHPHVCGENAHVSRVASLNCGSPPRVWGKLGNVMAR